MREMLTRLADRLRRPRLDRELDEELTFHRQQLEQESLQAGADADAARRLSRLRLGNTTAIREATREQWGFPTLDGLARDVRYAARALRRSPAFTSGVILTLALGIGANAAMFDVIDRLMFRPLTNLRDPATVHRLYFQTTGRTGATADHWTPYARGVDLRNWTHAFSVFAGFNERQLRVGSDENARERQVSAVNASFFDLFDAPPMRGRYFGPSEDVPPRGSAVSVLGYEFWRTEFGGREVIGDTLQVGSLSTTIVGVAHPSLRGVNDSVPAAVFVPISSLGPIFGGQIGAQHSVGYDNFWGSLLVRRKPGVPVEEAERDATQAFRRSWEAQRAAQPRSDRPAADAADPRVLVGSVRPGGGPAPALEVQTALWVTGVAVIVLLIACANLSSLMLSRAIAREHELATLMALGATRAHLLTRTFAETLLLAVSGAMGSVAVAQLGSSAIFGLLVTNTDDPASAVSPRTLAMVGLAALAVGLVLGLLPALFARRAISPRAVKAVGRGATMKSPWLQGTLVAVQSALSLLLLAGAVLFARSLDAVTTLRYGYDAERVLLVNTVLRGPALPPAERAALASRLVEAARQVPGVEAAALKVSTPLGLNAAMRFFVDGVPSVNDRGSFTAQAASEDYFTVMGTRILRGRAFTADDRGGAPPVAVVSSGMAGVLWPGQDALGQCLRIGSERAPCTTIIGIAEDIVQTSIQSGERYQYYLPIAQSPGGGTGLVLRMRGDPAQDAERVRRALQPLMPGLSYVTTQPLDELVTRAQRSWRLGAAMFGILSGLALLVAGVGLYGVVRYSVTRRRHEMSVRAALGARAPDLVRLVLGPNLRYAATGVALGTMVAVAARQKVQPLLFQQSASDPSVYAIAAAVLAVAILAATVGPAIRAARVPPGGALRAD